jgi:hypothetical protein
MNLNIKIFNYVSGVLKLWLVQLIQLTQKDILIAGLVEDLRD